MIPRLARAEDKPALLMVMEAAIAELQKGFLSEEQIASSRQIMGLDSQLIEDGTYFLVEENGLVLGCGGWSRRTAEGWVYMARTRAGSAAGSSRAASRPGEWSPPRSRWRCARTRPSGRPAAAAR